MAEYYFGKVCDKHPDLKGERRRSSRICLGCSRDKRAAWRRANPEKAKAQVAMYLPKWLKANADYVRESGKLRMREWRKANLTKVKDAANSPEMRAYRSARRAKERMAKPQWADDSAINRMYQWAESLTKTTGFKWQVDHVVPLQSGRVCGLHWEGNLQVISAKENIAKGNRHWPNM